MVALLAASFRPQPAALLQMLYVGSGLMLSLLSLRDLVRVGLRRAAEPGVERAHRVWLTQVPTPFTDALLGLARLHARTLGLYPEEASPLAARPQQG